MPAADIEARLAILADAAKYDASCASSGAAGRNALASRGIGSTEGSGICHAYAPDGRCISLLKILMTNACIFDCAYCVNRVSSDVPRARFTPEEVADLTMAFYRRNYVEGLFLSSGIVRSSDHTMEQMVRAVRLLREAHGFLGYVHLKAIPGASPALVEAAGRLADRLSINVELPTERGLRRLAPEKDGRTIRRAMGGVRRAIEAARPAAKDRAKPPRFAPAGQSTQLIVGADGASDAEILAAGARLYAGYRLKRVYYTAFSPIPNASAALPATPAPLRREHRLYQADWLTRFYGFGVDEVVSATREGMLDLALDLKTAWALANRHLFPVDVNRAPREMLLRVPGLGVRTVDGILSARRHRTLGLEDLSRLTRTLARARPFILARGWRPSALLDRADLEARLAAPARQLDLFAA